MRIVLEIYFICSCCKNAFSERRINIAILGVVDDRNVNSLENMRTEIYIFSIKIDSLRILYKYQ